MGPPRPAFRTDSTVDVDYWVVHNPVPRRKGGRRAVRSVSPTRWQRSLSPVRGSATALGVTARRGRRIDLRPLDGPEDRARPPRLLGAQISVSGLALDKRSKKSKKGRRVPPPKKGSVYVTCWLATKRLVRTRPLPLAVNPLSWPGVEGGGVVRDSSQLQLMFRAHYVPREPGAAEKKVASGSVSLAHVSANQTLKASVVLRRRSGRVYGNLSATVAVKLSAQDRIRASALTKRDLELIKGAYEDHAEAGSLPAVRLPAVLDALLRAEPPLSVALPPIPRFGTGTDVAFVDFLLAFVPRAGVARGRGRKKSSKKKKRRPQSPNPREPESWMGGVVRTTQIDPIDDPLAPAPRPATAPGTTERAAEPAFPERPASAPPAEKEDSDDDGDGGGGGAEPPEYDNDFEEGGGSGDESESESEDLSPGWTPGLARTEEDDLADAIVMAQELSRDRKSVV